MGETLARGVAPDRHATDFFGKLDGST